MTILNTIAGDNKNSYVLGATSNIGLNETGARNPRSIKLSELQYHSGVQRLEIYKIGLAQDEDPWLNGLPAWRIVEGTHPEMWNQIRFFGPGWTNYIGPHGAEVYTNNPGDYILVTGIFDAFGLLVYNSTTQGNQHNVYVDGVGSTLSTRAAVVYQNTNVRANTIVSSDSLKNLGLDLHTIKVVNGSTDSNYGIELYGFEFISSTPKEEAGTFISNGGQVSLLQQTVAAPTMSGTKGGFAYRYFDPSDNTRKWAVQEPAAYTTKAAATIASSATTITVTTGNTNDMAPYHMAFIYDSTGKSELLRVLTVPTSNTFTVGGTVNAYTNATIELWCKYDSATDHSNEIVQGERHCRMFGAGIAADFQLLAGGNTGSNKVYTLDDGITTLHMSAGSLDPRGINNAEGIAPTVSNEMSYVFQGTGLDILAGTVDTSTRTFDIYIDGVTAKTISHTSAKAVWYKIVSDLPYQTHIIKIVCTSTPANSPVIQLFREYIPKKPTALANIEDNNILAVKAIAPSAVFNANVAALGFYTASKGATYFAPNKGWLLTNGTTGSADWAVGPSSNARLFKNYLGTNRLGAKAKIWFYGTGFEFFFNTSTGYNTAQFTLDGSITNFSAYTLRESLAGRFTASTGQLNANVTAGYARMAILDIPEGWHSLELTLLSGTAQFEFNGFGVFGSSYITSTPEGSLQQICATCDGNTKDLRVFKNNYLEDKKYNYVEVDGITSDPTTNLASVVPLPDMVAIIKTKGNPIEINFSGAFSESAGANWNIYIYVDGVSQRQVRCPAAAATIEPSCSIILPVQAGLHVVQLFWYTATTSSNIVTANTTLRNMTIKELGE